MSIDAFEKREQTLQLHANVLQAEQERIDGAPTSVYPKPESNSGSA